ncbi:MAPEG family protein [Roseibium sp. Sym1]|uniref:MAPEG family protein n=1 Tax=Roseibium sp. Sym1 TaxID=3016006 RepID=UPI0022B37C18|nr:MAPEG family protein [Roseibium sp. Sym1]
MLSPSPELLSTALAAGLTGLIWIPVILNRLAEMGLWTALKNPQPDVRPKADWAHRLANAHRNALENLAVFAPLAINVHLLEAGNGLTTAACFTFLASRAAHVVIYTFGIPLLRTIAFFAGFLCQMALLLRVLGMV